jgi:succinoglycan biosynthesis protein ExoM
MNAPASVPISPLLIDICVCTFRRASLADTLASLAALHIPEGAILKVIVADNDIWPSARGLVGSISGNFPHQLVHVHAPARNISIARNACLDAAEGDFLAFVDDDEVVTRPWLARLLDTALSTGADAVLGPVRANYRPDAPAWMRQTDSHSTFPVRVKGEIRTGYTCNVLLNRTSPAIRELRFDLALGRSGGEDTDFFARLHQAGGSIEYAPEAWVEEPVPQARARFDWLARRRFRMGQTHGRLVARQSSVRRLPVQTALAGLKVLYCLAAATAFAPLPARRNPSILRGIMHAGVVAGLLGFREIHQYGAISSDAEHGHAA